MLRGVLFEVGLENCDRLKRVAHAAVKAHPAIHTHGSPLHPSKEAFTTEF